MRHLRRRAEARGVGAELAARRQARESLRQPSFFVDIVGEWTAERLRALASPLRSVDSLSASAASGAAPTPTPEPQHGAPSPPIITARPPTPATAAAAAAPAAADGVAAARARLRAARDRRIVVLDAVVGEVRAPSAVAVERVALRAAAEAELERRRAGGRGGRVERGGASLGGGAASSCASAAR